MGQAACGPRTMSSRPIPFTAFDRAALAVRDLASGAELAWQPVSNQTAAPTVAVLKSLIDQHGPPLVLKSDNGSAFASEEFGEVLASHEIVWLTFSRLHAVVQWQL